MRDLALVVLGVLLSMTFGFAFPKTYDEKKWEAIEANKVLRRATEARYEGCVRQCQTQCN